MTIVLAAALLLAAAFPAAAQSIPAVGERFPDVVCVTPPDSAHRSYLGIGDDPTFSLSRINADLVIVEIFSMYCPYCQQEAPVVNRLFEAVNGNSKLRDRVKIVGIGAGNSAYEVNYFRKTYEVPFPLIPDADFAIHQQIGEVRTPTFFALRITPDGNAEVVHVHSGRLPDHRRFLDTAVRKAGL